MTEPAPSSPSSPPPRAARPKSPMDITPRLASFVPEGYFAVGRVVGVHGMGGEIKVEPFTDFPERFAAGNELLLGDNLDEVTILSSRPHKSNMLLKLANLGNRNDAELLRGQWLFVPEEEAAQLDAGSYWVHDLLGMEVVTEEGAVLGTIYDVLFTGANEVYIVRSAEGANELLLPAIDQVVRAVDVAARRMTVHLLPGLLD